MHVIRSSRVLYSGCCLWYFVLWFSSCWSGVELRVMCPVCRMLAHQHPANRTHNPVRGARKVVKHCHNLHSWNTVVCNSRSNQRMNVSLTPYNTDAFLNNCTWRPLLPDHIPACQMTLPSHTTNVISRHIRGFWHRRWTRFKRSVVHRISAPRWRMCQRSLPSAESLQSAAQANRRAQRTQCNVGFVKKCDRPSAFSYILNTHTWLWSQVTTLSHSFTSTVNSRYAPFRIATFRCSDSQDINTQNSLFASNPCYYDSVSDKISYPELVENFIHPRNGLRYVQIVSVNRSERTD